MWLPCTSSCNSRSFARRSSASFATSWTHSRTLLSNFRLHRVDALHGAYRQQRIHVATHLLDWPVQELSKIFDRTISIDMIKKLPLLIGQQLSQENPVQGPPFSRRTLVPRHSFLPQLGVAHAAGAMEHYALPTLSNQTSHRHGAPDKLERSSFPLEETPQRFPSLPTPVHRAHDRSLLPIDEALFPVLP